MPITLDLYAIFIFMGIVQGVFIGLFFIFDKPRKQHNVFYGLTLLCIALSLFEIWMMYTGYIQFTLWLVDFSEPLTLAIGPFTFLYVRSLIEGTVPGRIVWRHLMFPAIYCFAMIPFLVASNDLKYNSWIFAYHPEAPLRELSAPYPEAWLWVTDHHLFLVIVSFVLYLWWCSVEVVTALRQKEESFLRPRTPALQTIRTGVLILAAMVIGVMAVKFINPRDTGDQYIALLATLGIYVTSFFVIRNSAFFRQVPLSVSARVKSTGVAPEEVDRIALLLEHAMENDKVFAQPDVSVATLGKTVNTPAYVVSQVINERFGMGFFEWMAQYRVAEAKRILRDSPHIKIEHVAGQVGYNSKSSFNTSFKKLTGMTPSEYRHVRGD